MALARTYLPLTPADVAALAADGNLPAGHRGSAVTDSVRSAEPSAGTELWEHSALLAAIDLADDLEAAARVVIAAADIDPSALSVVDGATVVVGAPVPLRRIASFLVGEGNGGARTGSARGTGELSWYDVTELAEVSRLTT